MKHLLILALWLATFSFAQAQNGGQFFENNVIRVVYVKYDAGTHTFKVVNKQSCTATIRTKADTDAAVDITVNGGDSTYVTVYRGNPGNVKFRVKAETSCPSFANPDMGWLELNTANISLPLNEMQYVQMRERREMNVRVQGSRWLYVEAGSSKTYNMTVEVVSTSGVRTFYLRSKLYRNSTVDLGYSRSGIYLIRVVLESGVKHTFHIKTIN